MASGRSNLEAAAALGTDVGDLLGAAEALHGLARMGRARQVVDQLGELAERVDGELTAARLAYALGAARRDSRGLDEAAAQFEALGANLYAAEALGESAVHLLRAGMSREAASSQQTRRPPAVALRARRHAVRPRHRGPGPAHPGRARHGTPGGHRAARTSRSPRSCTFPCAPSRTAFTASTRSSGSPIAVSWAKRCATCPSREPRPGGRRHRAQRTASHTAHPVSPKSTTAVTIRTVAMLTTRSTLWPADDRERGHRPEGEERADTDRERIVVVRRKVGGEDLRQVAPLGQEDDHERGDRDALM